ncbi:MAG: 4-(cytidine 5'-diphospho)-2-C-methyl-D-erythritol kinase [Candidatus Pelagibacter sp.]|nr:4-(cytidine 5'-diphospho)-2-C-methyl-D-erythritol kinase [Candidatus Pelagibacter sp.]OUV87698.1 MAG: 4-(cytidine 5'-diphospho)-2-C-methyl-D-erythritol kinase [Pelagibacteraceae bacterium TMED136]
MSKIKSYAKINLFLKVIGKNKKYHQLYSLITQINLFDEISIKENKNNKDNVYFSGAFKIKNKKNTITNLLYLTKNKFPILKNKYFDIFVRKNIPVGSGLGGASSNATTVFNYLKKKFKIKISDKKSKELLAKIGKDCPLFLNRKVKLIQSTGENFIEYQSKLNLQMLLIYPNYKISTKDVFFRFKKPLKKLNKKKLILNNKEKLLKICKFYGNDLLKSAHKTTSRLKSFTNLIEKIDNCNFYSMTGSGSVFFLIFNKKKSLLNAQKMIKKRNSFWTTLVKTI